ncbi:MAG: amidohydrolase family protein [Clostridia bacterium]|nr:amidohydrolase family protein [Clostridia bacterium]
MIIDFHTHIFPDKIATRTLEVLKAGIKEYENLDAEAFFDGTKSGLLSFMEENGVDISVALPIATKPSQTESINTFALSVSDKKIVSFASLHPDNENTDEILENIKRDGFIGIKLHPEFQRSFVDSDKIIRILKKAEKLQLYTVFHAGQDIGLPPPVHSTPLHFRNALEYVSGKYIIAAHLGGWRMWDDVEKYLVGTPIIFDTAFIKDHISPSQASRIINSHGSEKILFGSDAPWERSQDTLDFLISLGLDEKELENIKYKNAQKILKNQV